MKDYSFFIVRSFGELDADTGGRRLLVFFLSQVLLGSAVMLFPSLWALVPILSVWLMLCRLFRAGVLKAFAALLLIGFVVIESSIFLSMARYNLVPAPLTGQETMIIPGAAVQSGAPGNLLKGRLDRAVPILKNHPAMAVIVSGGRSPEDESSEASVMRTYLIRQGVATERIFEEPLARDTIGNFANSAELIRREALSANVIIITSGFHSFRSETLARTAGLDPKVLPASDSARSLPRHLLREAASWVKVILTFGSALR